MVAVIFEVEPTQEGHETYLQWASALRAELESTEGFVSVERFQSLAQPGKILSLSFWRDEEAVKAWRHSVDHRAAQHAGRAGVFNNYRLRVAHVLRDYGMHERDQAPSDARGFHG